MKRFLCCALALAAAVTLTACSASQSTARSEAYSETHDYAAPEAAAVEYGEFEGGGSVSLPIATPSANSQFKMVYSVELQLQTLSFNEGTRKLLNTVEEMGGFILSANVRGRDLHYKEERERFAQYTMKIPTDNLPRFLVLMEDNYNLLELNQTSQDITGKYTATDSQLEGLREQEARLLAELETEQDSETRLEIESELSYIRDQISGYTASSTNMENDINYSTVSVNLYEVILTDMPAESEPTFSEKFNQTTSGSWSGFVRFWQYVALFLTAVLPILVILIALGGIVLVILQIIKRARLKKLTKLPASGSNNKDNSNNNRQ